MAIRVKKIGSDVYTEAYTLGILISKYGYSRNPEKLENQLFADNWFECDDCGFYYDANYNSYAHKNRFNSCEKIICHNCSEHKENLETDVNQETENILHNAEIFL